MKPTVMFVLLSSALLSAGALAQGGAGGKQGQTEAQQGGARGAGQQARVRDPSTHSPEVVKKAQQALKDKGMDPGPIDGQYGPKTAAAVRKFQEQEKLQVSGRFDQETLSALGVEGSATGAGGGSGGTSSGGAGSTSGSSGNQK